MKKKALFLIMILSTVNLAGQNYLISFAASGAAPTVDSVIVENLSQGTSIVIQGANQLQLVGMLTGIDQPDLEFENALNIYPNPALEDIEFSFAAATDATAYLELFDLNGKLISEAQAYLLPGRHAFQISGLSRGTYIIRVRSAGYGYSGKIISYSASGLRPRISYNEQAAEMGQGKLKSTDTLVQMQYNDGDRLKFIGKSGNFSTIMMDVPRIGKVIRFIFTGCTDGDNNHYPTVKIGNQLWMAENLKTTKFSNGINVPNVTGAAQWASLLTGAYCNYDNLVRNVQTYGRLYNWYAVNDSRNICPPDWHVPTDAEWTALANFLGGEAVAGGKMKETGTAHWFSVNVRATNETGLTIVPGGYRHESGGDFPAMGYGGSYWTGTSQDASTAFNRDIFYYTAACNYHATGKRSGLSVRCIKN